MTADYKAEEKSKIHSSIQRRYKIFTLKSIKRISNGTYLNSFNVVFFYTDVYRFISSKLRVNAQ